MVSPVATDLEGNTYNINADIVAGNIAAAMKAKKLIILTDVPGILRDFDKKGVDVIVMEGVDGGGIARTIGSRLKKASDEVCRV